MSTARPLSAELLKAFESVPDLYLILSPDLMILTASDAYLAATFTSRERIRGCPLFGTFPDNPHVPRALKTLQASLDYVLSSRQPHRMPLQRYEVQRPSHLGGGIVEKFWQPLNTPVLDENDQLYYIIHKVDDMTFRVKAEEQNKVHEELLNKAELIGGLGTYECDLCTMQFQFSDGMFRLLGYEPHTVPSTLDFMDSISEPEDAEAIRQIIGRATQCGEPYQYLRRIHLTTGEMRYILDKGKVFFDTAGKPVKMIGMAQDITELRRAELEVQRLNEEITRKAASGMQTHQTVGETRP
jgi:PAS domain S-box-containing protein